MNNVDVLVVGAGVSGLATAWWLARQGLRVQVWESDTRIGGRICTDHSNGYLTERAATMIMNFLPEVSQLVAATGLETNKLLRAPNAKRYLVHRSRLTEVPMRPGALLASPLWTLRGKLRMLAEPLVPRGGHESETVSEFITRRLGREMLERAMEPYIAGPLGSDPDHASARAVLPRLTGLEQDFGSLTAGALYHRLRRRRSTCAMEAFSFGSGMSTLIQALSDTPGVRVLRNHRVDDLAPVPGGWQVSTAAPGRRIHARHVVLGTPAVAAASLVASLDRTLARLLREIEYAPMSAVHLGFARSSIERRLDGTGFLVPRSEQRVPNGCLWASTLFPGRAPPDKVLLTCYLGGARARDAATWEDERTLDAVLSSLNGLIGIRSQPEMVRIDRHAQGLPLYHGAYQARLKAIEARLTRLPGLHLEAGYKGGVSVRDRIVRGHSVAHLIAESIPECDNLDGLEPHRDTPHAGLDRRLVPDLSG